MTCGKSQDEKVEKMSLQAAEIACVKARDVQGIAKGLTCLKHGVCIGT